MSTTARFIGANAPLGRLRARWPNLILVHLPIHASWLNQTEIYFSIVQRKALTLDDFATRADVRARLLGCQRHYQTLARPFEWRFTRKDPATLMQRCSSPPSHRNAA